MGEIKAVSVIAEEIVEAGRRFGNAWAKLKEKRIQQGERREKWFDNMVIRLDSPTADGFHVTLRKMIRELSQEEKLKWNIKKEVLAFLSDKTRTSWRHAFLTGVFFGYYGYFKREEVNKNG